MTPTQVVPVVAPVVLPPGMAGPDPLSFDVRCYLSVRADGITLIDTGLQAEPITTALADIGADWSDVRDVVLTHAHPDHVGALATARSLAPSAALWGGGAESFPVAVDTAAEGLTIGGLRVLATPGHTPGHLCLLDEDAGMLFTGDAIGSQDGQLSLGPAPFIADRAQALRTLVRLAELKPARLLFGHGGEVADPTAALHRFLDSD